MAQKPDDAMERLAALNRAGRGRVSPYRWMKRRYEAFAEMIAEKPPDWRALAEGFAEMGITARDGSPLSPETLRNSWWRVRRDVEAAKVKPAPTARPVAVEVPSSAPPPVPVATPAPAPAPPEGGLDAKDALAELRRQLNERSGRKG